MDEITYIWTEEIYFNNGKKITNVHCMLRGGFLIIPHDRDSYSWYNQNIIRSMINVIEMTQEEWEGRA